MPGRWAVIYQLLLVPVRCGWIKRHRGRCDGWWLGCVGRHRVALAAAELHRGSCHALGSAQPDGRSREHSGDRGHGLVVPHSWAGNTYLGAARTRSERPGILHRMQGCHTETGSSKTCLSERRNNVRHTVSILRGHGTLLGPFLVSTNAAIISFFFYRWNISLTTWPRPTAFTVTVHCNFYGEKGNDLLKHIVELPLRWLLWAGFAYPLFFWLAHSRKAQHCTSFARCLSLSKSSFSKGITEIWISFNFLKRLNFVLLKLHTA